jgi:hypothetical protein
LKHAPYNSWPKAPLPIESPHHAPATFLSLVANKSMCLRATITDERKT